MTTPQNPTDALRDEVHDQTTAAVTQTATAAAARTARQWWPWTVAACVLVALVVSSATAVAVYHLRGQQEQVAAAVSEVRRLAEEAKRAGDAANEALLQRGQPPVPIPQPGRGDDTEVLVAAATARVLASIPDPSPTAGELAASIAQFVAARPGVFAPSPQQIGEQVAGYLVANPPPPGEPGRDGTNGQPGRDGADGRTPTAEDIRAALVTYLQENPDALCPRGGSYSQLRVRLADGGTADTWTCVVQVHPPTTTTTAEPPPLLPPGG